MAPVPAPESRFFVMTPIPSDPRSDAGKKVVDIASRAPDAGHDHVGGLLVAVREMTLKATANLVAELLDNVDDTLFDLAEKAESNASQTEYFDGMRETRKMRPRIERLFGERITRGFADFAAGRQPRGSDAQRAFSASGELSLVDDRELEESLAVSSMVAKADARLASALMALNQRLSVLSGGRSTTNTNNPLGPGALTEAFREALGELTEVNIRVRLIILKMFERYVLKALDTLYYDVNVRLVQAGVLPQLRHPNVVHRHASAGAAPRAASGAIQAAGGVGSVADYIADTADELHSELMQRLTSLLASRRQHLYGDAGGMSVAGGGIASLPPAAHDARGHRHHRRHRHGAASQGRTDAADPASVRPGQGARIGHRRGHHRPGRHAVRIHPAGPHHPGADAGAAGAPADSVLEGRDPRPADVRAFLAPGAQVA